MAEIIESTGLMEPMLPSEGQRELEDLAVCLIEKSAKMAGQLNPIAQEKIGNLVRSMNCYYSNLIEGHNTHPIDIERALKKEFDTDLKKRDLQLEAKAHIEVQAMIDNILMMKIFLQQNLLNGYTKILLKTAGEFVLG
jgi:Fic family protein